MCSFYHKFLRTGIKTNVDNFATRNHIVFKLSIRALKKYLKLGYAHELQNLLNTKVSAAKDHGKNYMKVRLPLAHYLSRNRQNFSLSAVRLFSQHNWIEDIQNIPVKFYLCFNLIASDTF